MKVQVCWCLEAKCQGKNKGQKENGQRQATTKGILQRASERDVELYHYHHNCYNRHTAAAGFEITDISRDRTLTFFLFPLRVSSCSHHSAL